MVRADAVLVAREIFRYGAAVGLPTWLSLVLPPRQAIAQRLSRSLAEGSIRTAGGRGGADIGTGGQGAYGSQFHSS
jgi:hypothetical protein